MGVDSFFGNAHFLSNIIHSNTLKPIGQEHVGGSFKYFFFHSSLFSGRKYTKETQETIKVS
jgi:hypothetical protein